MAMSYTTLTGSKGTSGSIANWVSYSRLDLPVIVDEAQALIYEYLRVRQMETTFNFTMPIGSSWVALPARFLDPIGSIFSPSVNLRFEHRDPGFVKDTRSYSETTGTLGANPLTTTNGSTQISVAFTAHGFNQGSTFNLSGATAVGGITPSGAYEIVSVTNANAFVIDNPLNSAATSGATGGGSAITYTCDNLTQGAPIYWSAWDERIQFDSAFVQQYMCSLMYYQSLPLLSSTNTTNFITDRYPNLMRTACQAAAADYMKDDGEYAKCLQRLTSLIQRIQTQDDLMLRGADIYTETP